MTAARSTKTPGIPEVREDNVLDVLRAIKSTMEVREGRSGDDEDAHVRFRDLTALGLTEEGKTKSGDGDIPVGPPGGGGATDDGGGYDPTGDTSIPPAPTNLMVEGAFTTMHLSWDGAPYRNHGYTEVWRNTTDNLATAILVGSTIGNLYPDVVDYDSTYYYWVRFVSRANITGPWNSTAGTMGHTALDVGKAIEALSAAMVNSPLWTEMGQRIAQIQADNYAANRGLVSKFEQLAAADVTANSRLLELWNLSQTQTTALRLLESRGPGNGNAIYFTPDRPDSLVHGEVNGLALGEGDIWYDTNDDNRSYRWTVGSEWVEFTLAGAKVYHQATDPASFNGTDWVDSTGRIIREGDLWYDSDSTPEPNHPYRWSSVTDEWLDFESGDNTAQIVELEQTKIGYATLDVASPYGAAGAVFDNSGAIWNNVPSGSPDYSHSVGFWNETHPANIPGTDSRLTWHIGLPFAQATKQIGVSVVQPFGGGTTQSTLQQQMTVMQATDNTLVSQYTVKIDTNGYVSGFGLANTAPGGPGTPIVSSAFVVNADTFAIGPAMPGAKWMSASSYLTNDVVWMQQGNGTTGPKHVFQARKGSVGPPPVSNVGHMPVWNATKLETDPWWVDLSARLPFMATTIAQTIDGKTYPPGVWMNTANIADATIQNAQIETLVAEKITTGTLKATVGITTGKIYYGVNLTQPFASATYGKGFFLGDDGGVVKFFVGDNDVQNMTWDGTQFEVRGRIIGRSGRIGGINMQMDPAGAGQLFSDGNTAFGVGTGFFLDGTGMMRLGKSGNDRMEWNGTTFTIYGPGNKIILASGTGIDWGAIGSGTPPAGLINTNIKINSDGTLTGANPVGQVTPNGINAVNTNLSNAPGGIVNTNITLSGAVGVIKLVGAGGGQATDVIMRGFRIPKNAASTYIEDAAIDTLQVANAAIGGLQVADAAISNLKVADAAITTLKVGGNAITVPTMVSWNFDEPVGFSREVWLFQYDPVNHAFDDPNVIPTWVSLNTVTEMSLVTFTTELVQGSGTNGAVIELNCYLNRANASGGIGTLVAKSTMKIGIINNQPRFTQTAVFPFVNLPIEPKLIIRMTARQVADGDGKTSLTTQNILGKKVLSFTGMKR